MFNDVNRISCRTRVTESDRRLIVSGITLILSVLDRID